MLNKKKIKQFLPFLLPLVLLPEYLIDYYKYVRYSGLFREKHSREKLIGKIIAEYHIIEKGLTMPETRLGFGQENVFLLVHNCTEYIRRFGSGDNQVEHAISVILEYRNYHINKEYLLGTVLLDKISILEKEIPGLFACEQSYISKDIFFGNINSSFKEFSASRKSVRNYSKDDVSMDRIVAAVDLARNAPSSCNRQGTRVYVFSDAEIINKILTIQGGNRGFGHLANKLIIITAELGVSHGVFERHQVYVDGGMYAMNLLYSLHYNQIAACSLNCNFSIQKDRDIRKLCKIKDSEVFVVMISCGIPPDSFQVALSKRYSLDKVLTVL